VFKYLYSLALTKKKKRFKRVRRFRDYYWHRGDRTLVAVVDGRIVNFG